MPVIIEELEAEVVPPARAPGGAEAAPPGPQEMDERKVLETIARESWRLRRLEAD
jgi:hypothetical protein